MTDPDVMLAALQRSFDLWRELIETLPEEALGRTLPGLPSNTIGAQLWCVVGARESYGRAIAAGGEWAGFSCSLTAEESGRSSAVGVALRRSAKDLLETWSETPEPSPAAQARVLELLEHEAAHQGQLIRYLYALPLPIPEGWRRRYSLR